MNVRSAVDRRFPRVTSNYRRLRDFLYYRRLKPEETIYGFAMYGRSDLDTSRAGDGEAGVFLEMLAAAGAVVDVGANAGLFSLLAARGGKPVLAVEPHPQNLQLLLKNVQMAGPAPVEVFAMALSDAVGVLKLYGSRQGASLKSHWGGVPPHYSCLTPVNRLDNLLDGRFPGEKILIKIDVEGNEMATLAGAAGTLARRPSPSWLIEHGLTENFAGATNPHFVGLFDLFRGHGYACTCADAGRREVTAEDVARWVRAGAKDFGGINYCFERADP